MPTLGGIGYIDDTTVGMANNRTILERFAKKWPMNLTNFAFGTKLIKPDKNNNPQHYFFYDILTNLLLGRHFILHSCMLNLTWVNIWQKSKVKLEKTKKKLLRISRHEMILCLNNCLTLPNSKRKRKVVVSRILHTLAFMHVFKCVCVCTRICVGSGLFKVSSQEKEKHSRFFCTLLFFYVTKNNKQRTKRKNLI